MKRKPIVYFTTVIRGKVKLNLGIQVNLKKEYIEMEDEQFQNDVIDGYIKSAFSERHGDKSLLLTLHPRIDFIEPQENGTNKYHYELIGDSIPVVDMASLSAGIIKCHDILGKQFDLGGNFSLQIRKPYGYTCRGDERALMILQKLLTVGRIWLEDIK